MSACTGYIAYSGSARVDRRCPNAAAEIVTAGCIHEHIGEHALCPMRADEAREGVLLCGDCLKAGGSSRRCYLRVLASIPSAAGRTS